MKYFTQKYQCAFTLLEILVALSIVVLIMTAVYGSYKAATISISHCKPKSIIEQQARLFLERFTSELRCCYPGKENQPGYSTSQSIIEKEVIHKAVQKKDSLLFIGKEISKGNIFLQFVTSSFTSSQYYNMGGLAIVSYKIDESGKILLRNIRKHIEGYEGDSKDYQWLPALSNVKNISCEYFDDEQWQKEWKSKESKILPQAVKITIVLENDETGPLSFESCAYIMCNGFQNSEPIFQEVAAASDM